MNMELPNSIIPALIIVLSTILINAILGILLSIKTREFDINKLPEFFINAIFPYLGGLLVLAIAAKYIGLFYTEVYYGLTTPIFLKYANDIVLKLKDLFTSNNFNDLSKF